jgi:hypothetical protein
MRMSMPCALAALLLTAAPATAEKQTWGFVKSGSEVLLVYGVPESEAITLSFICHPKRKSIEIVTTVLPQTAKQGRAGTIKLSNGSTSLEYSGKTGRDNAESGVHFAAPTTIQPRLFDLLETGASLRIEALGARDSVPLGRIKAPLAQMRKACR